MTLISVLCVVLQCHAIGLVSVSVCCSTCAQVRAYQGHMRELEACNDPVVRATAAFMRLMADVVSFDDSTKRGDAYMMEIVHARWLPFFKVCNKPRYATIRFYCSISVLRSVLLSVCPLLLQVRGMCE